MNPCTVCRHPDRQEIDRLLLSDTSLRTVAQKFNLAVTSLHRHRRNHLLPPATPTQRDAPPPPPPEPEYRRKGCPVCGSQSWYRLGTRWLCAACFPTVLRDTTPF